MIKTTKICKLFVLYSGIGDSIIVASYKLVLYAGYFVADAISVADFDGGDGSTLQ